MLPTLRVLPWSLDRAACDWPQCQSTHSSLGRQHLVPPHVAGLETGTKANRNQGHMACQSRSGSDLPLPEPKALAPGHSHTTHW